MSILSSFQSLQFLSAIMSDGEILALSWGQLTSKYLCNSMANLGINPNIDRQMKLRMLSMKVGANNGMTDYLPTGLRPRQEVCKLRTMRVPR